MSKNETIVKDDEKTGVNETLTLHAALRELKTLDKRIRQVINSVEVCKAVSANNTTADSICIALKNGRAALQQSLDLIRRYDVIKRAIIMSNALTVIGKPGNAPTDMIWVTPNITVAEVIEKRGAYLTYLHLLLDVVRKNVSGTTVQAERITETAQNNALKLISSNSTPEAGSADMETYEAYLNAHKGVIVNAEGVDLDELINSLETEINIIETTYDASLSVANATASISISYPVGRFVL